MNDNGLIEEKVIQMCPVCWHNTADPRREPKAVETISLICGHCGYAAYERHDMLPNDELNALLRARGKEPVPPLDLRERVNHLVVFTRENGDLPLERKAQYMGPFGDAVPDTLKVRISVRGGVAYVKGYPDGVKVEIVDHDNEVNA